MIQLSGIFSESLGGTCTIRGYAKYNEIVELSYPHPGYQRPAEDEHVAEISSFITSGSNSFSPEVVLAYTAKYNYYAQGASSEVDALADIRSGKGFTSNVDGIAFKKEKAAGNGFLYTLSIPDKKYDRIEDKPSSIGMFARQNRQFSCQGVFRQNTMRPKMQFVVQLMK